MAAESPAKKARLDVSGVASWAVQQCAIGTQLPHCTCALLRRPQNVLFSNFSKAPAKGSSIATTIPDGPVGGSAIRAEPPAPAASGLGADGANQDAAHLDGVTSVVVQLQAADVRVAHCIPMNS